MIADIRTGLIRYITGMMIIIFCNLLLVSCGGDGNGNTADTTTSDNSDTDNGTDIVAPAIQGFDINLEADDYWEYRWDYYSYSWAQGSDPKTTFQTGRFRVSLGTPVSISETQAFPVVVSGVTDYTPSSGTPTNYSPRWKYLATKENKILGSTDGVNLSIIFDAQNGFWPGGGFFINMGTTSLNQAQSGTISSVQNVTQYISGSVIKTGLAGSQSTCEYYPGFGTICGDSSYSYDQWEYFLPNLGPYGYFYHNSYSDCGGGFCSGGTWEQLVGLTSSSLLGNTVDYVLENEPNDSLANAQPLTNKIAVLGMAFPFASGWDVTGKNILVGPDTYGWSVIEDIYRFTLPLSVTARPVTISLDFTGATAPIPDYDLYLINSSGTSRIASSTNDNPSNGIYTEEINYSLGSGTYIVGIEAFSNSSKAEYKLKVSW